MNIKNIDLNLLLAFDALLAERSVSRAAMRVGLTQPAMSNALARLRIALNDRILVRTGRTMTPTANALGFAVPVREALGLIEKALGQPKSALDSRTVVIGATEYAEHLLIPRFVREIARSGLNLKLVIRRLPALFQAPEDDLQAGLLELAIGFFPEAHSLRPGIHSKRLLLDENVCVVSEGHGAALSKLTLERYCSLDHVSIFYQKDGLSLVDRLLFEKGLRRNVVVQVPHLASALTIVARTKLATIVPRRFAVDFGRRLPLQCLTAPLDLPRIHLNLLWHARSDSDPGLISIREHLANISLKCALQGKEEGLRRRAKL